jgi:ketosteroid isomerase-like protein
MQTMDATQTTATRDAAPESPLVGRVRDALAAHRRGGEEAAAAFDILSPAVLVHVPGDSPLSGELRGRETLQARLARLHALSGGTFAPVDTSLAGLGEFVVLVHRVRAERGGARLETTLAETWRFADGRCVESWVQFGDPHAWDAFWR